MFFLLNVSQNHQLNEPKTSTASVCVHRIDLIHEFHNLSWITEINELFHDILIYWDAPVYTLRQWGSIDTLSYHTLTSQNNYNIYTTSCVYPIIIYYL